MKYGEGKRFLARTELFMQRRAFPLSSPFFSRNNCRDNVASVWIPPLLSVLGKKAMVGSYNRQVAKVEAK